MLDLDQLKVLTVTDVTRRVKSTLEGDPALQNVLIKGELSNVRHHSSGHIYFTLKDEGARLRAVLFRSRAQSLKFRPEDGLGVVADGSIGVYEGGGEYQFYVENLYPAGAGALHVAYEQLRFRLQNEGLFDPARKRPLPALPRCIGIVTSPTGAAVRDMISVLRRRYPNIEILLAPAVVQGEAGPQSVVSALDLLHRDGRSDVIIAGRGGGSLEELWTFNDERVARAIAASRIPVISAVGHETDYTIADFVADRRAPTPSAAAEMAVPEKAALAREIHTLRTRVENGLRRRWQIAHDKFRLLSNSPALKRPHDRIKQARLRLDELLHRAQVAGRHRFQGGRKEVAALAGKLDTLSPLGTLQRGYSIVRTKDRVLRSASEVAVGDRVDVLLQQGRLNCVVESVSGSEPTLTFEGRKSVDPSPDAKRARVRRNRTANV